MTIYPPAARLAGLGPARASELRQRTKGALWPPFPCIYDEVGVVGETMRRGVIIYSARRHIAGAGAEPEARGAARNSLWQPRDGGDLADYRAAWRGGPGKAIVD
jgi:hypothetical protein